MKATVYIQVADIIPYRGRREKVRGRREKGEGTREKGEGTREEEGEVMSYEL